MNTIYTAHAHPTVSHTHVHMLSHTHASLQFLRWLAPPGPSICLAFFVLENLHVSTFLPKICTEQCGTSACRPSRLSDNEWVELQGWRAGEGGGEGRANSRVSGIKVGWPEAGTRPLSYLWLVALGLGRSGARSTRPGAALHAGR